MSKKGRLNHELSKIFNNMRERGASKHKLKEKYKKERKTEGKTAQVDKFQHDFSKTHGVHNDKTEHEYWNRCKDLIEYLAEKTKVNALKNLNADTIHSFLMDFKKKDGSNPSMQYFSQIKAAMEKLEYGLTKFYEKTYDFNVREIKRDLKNGSRPGSTPYSREDIEKIKAGFEKIYKEGKITDKEKLYADLIRETGMRSKKIDIRISDEGKLVNYSKAGKPHEAFDNLVSSETKEKLIYYIQKTGKFIVSPSEYNKNLEILKEVCSEAGVKYDAQNAFRHSKMLHAAQDALRDGEDWRKAKSESSKTFGSHYRTVKTYFNPEEDD